MDFIGLVTEVILDVFKENTKETNEQKKIGNLIKDYLDRIEKNEFVSFDNEIDFEGFCDFVRKSLIEDIRYYITARGSEQERIRITIINKVIASSKARSSGSREKVKSLTVKIINIIYDFYRASNDKNLLLLVGEIEKTLSNAENNIIETENKNAEKIISELKEIKNGFYKVNNCFEENLKNKRIFIESSIKKEEKI